MTVWVVTNALTFPEATVIAVFSSQSQADAFVAKRNESKTFPIFLVHKHVVDQWAAEDSLT